jgi:hypothetical protein
MAVKQGLHRGAGGRELFDEPSVFNDSQISRNPQRDWGENEKHALGGVDSGSMPMPTRQRATQVRHDGGGGGGAGWGPWAHHKRRYRVATSARPARGTAFALRPALTPVPVLFCQWPGNWLWRKLGLHAAEVRAYSPRGCAGGAYGAL